MDHGTTLGRRLRIIALVAAGAVAAVTLFKVPLGTLLLFGILLLCPLLMTSMHGGGHGHEGTSRGSEEASPAPPPESADHPHGDSSARWK